VGNIHVTGSYKATNMSQNVFQKFVITNIKPFQQKTINAIISQGHLSVKTINAIISQGHLSVKTINALSFTCQLKPSSDTQC